MKRIRLDHEGYTLCPPALFFLALYVVKLKQTDLMKIEIGESLALSYLKHVKECAVYQTNWKLPSWWLKKLEGQSLGWNFYLELERSRREEAGLKGGIEDEKTLKSEFLQFLKQAEIDALGVDREGRVYAIDVAFHEKGLSYGSKVATRDCVIKKFVRSYLIMLSCFPGKACTVIFASPKVDKAKDDLIRAALKGLSNDDRFKDEMITFEYIVNKDFEKDILLPTIEASKDDADTNELFLRSCKLLWMPYALLDKKENENDATSLSPTSSSLLSRILSKNSRKRKN